MTNTDITQLADLVARFGFRISTLDAKSAGVPERVLFDAVCAGAAKIERMHVLSDRHLVTVYLVFA